MRKLLFLLLLLQGCNYKKYSINNCIYNFDSLILNYDSSNFVIQKYDDKQIDVIEKENVDGEKGIYTFDRNKILRFYAFLTNKNNDYYFHIDYDSLGNVIKKSSGETIKMKVRNYNTDSLAITILFFSLHSSYSNIRILAGGDSIENVKLKKSSILSNIIGNTVLIKKNSDKIYIEGLKLDNCSLVTTHFKDSAFVDPNSAH